MDKIVVDMSRDKLNFTKSGFPFQLTTPLIFQRCWCKLESHHKFVVSEGTNVATSKPAWQSSTTQQGFATNAVTGYQSSGVNFARTTITDSPWWIVDLEVEYEIKALGITSGHTNNFLRSSYSFHSLISRILWIFTVFCVGYPLSCPGIPALYRPD